jgi:hypothetical protein
MKIINNIIVIVLFTGCVAQKPNSIMPQQQNNKYVDYTCSDLEIKANEITSQSIELKKHLQNNHQNDDTKLIIGVLIAFPVLFAIQGNDKDMINLYSKVKGELLDIQEVNIQNKCNIQFSKDTLEIINIS